MVWAKMLQANMHSLVISVPSLVIVAEVPEALALHEVELRKIFEFIFDILIQVLRDDLHLPVYETFLVQYSAADLNPIIRVLQTFLHFLILKRYFRSF